MHITKKIYPTRGQARERLDKLSRTIDADRRAAFVFQAVETVLETAAVYVIIQSIGGLLAPSFADRFWAVSLMIAALCAYYIQLQYTVNLDMAVHIEEDEKLAESLPKTRDSYKKSRLVLFVLALVLNTVGGFILANKVTFKADKSSLEQLDKEHRQNIQRIEDNYKTALGGLASFDEQAAQSKSTWKTYSQARPNEQKYAALKAKEEGAALLNKKAAITEQATSTRAAEIKSEKASYERRRAAITSTLQEDMNKQLGWEIVAAIGSILFSLSMLTLVWIYHSRATRHELICGVSYKIQMPTNEHQSPVQTVEFLAKYIAYGLVQAVAVGVYKAANFVFRFRLNFTGHGDTVEQKQGVKINVVQATAEHSEVVQQSEDLDGAKAVQLEVSEGDHYPVQTAIEEERLERIKQARARAVAAANSSANNDNNSANSAYNDNNHPAQVDNSQGDNSANNYSSDNANTANNKTVQTASSSTRAGGFNLAEFRAAQFKREQGFVAQNNPAQLDIEQTETAPEVVEFETKQAAIKQGRADKIKASKSSILFEHNGQTYTVRDAEKQAGVYLSRAQNEASSEKAREENARRAQLWKQLAEIAMSKQNSVQN